MMSSYKTYSALDEKLKLKMLDKFVEIIIKTIKTGILDFKKELKYLFIILKGCGKDVKEFNWNCDSDCKQKISQEDFMKVLNLMPNLTNLRLHNVKLEEDEIEKNPRKKLKLDLDICKNLKFVVVNEESFLNFFSLNFAQHFVKNSHSKLSLGYYADYDELINIKSPQTELIKKLEVNQGENVQEEVKEILKFSNLEELEIMYFEKFFIEEISTLKHLKTLKFNEFGDDFSDQNWKFLEDIEKLEELSFYCSELDASFLRDVKLKSLRSFSLQGYVEGNEFVFENLLINSPNLKVLKVHHSPHKINFYAKHFKNLEKLHLEFVDEYTTSSIELDTGIVNKNLKELKVSYFGLKDEVNDLLEIVEIFPNLESIEIQWDAPLFANKFLFAKLNKLKNLKSLKCQKFIDINRCLDFIVDGALIEDLKSLSKKLESYDFGFKFVSDKVVDYKEVYIREYFPCKDVFPLTENEKENFKLFVNYLREHFEVDYDGHGRTCSLKK